MSFLLHDAIRRLYFNPNSEQEKTTKNLLSTEDVNQLDYTHTSPLGICVNTVERRRGKVDQLASDLMLSEYIVPKLYGEDLIVVLLKNGANPDIEDRRGWTLMHLAAWVNDLYFIRTCLRHGKGDIWTRNREGYLPVDLAVAKGHTHLAHYLDQQSRDLRAMCRVAIRQALGKRCGQLDKLHLPQRLKLFVNYNIPYCGFSAVLVPPEPWTSEQLLKKEVEHEEVRDFVKTHASEEFLTQHSEILEPANDLQDKALVTDELASVFQEMYLWESFKNVSYEEPLARPPRYSMQKCQSPKKS